MLHPLLISKEHFFLIIMNHLAEFLEMLMAFDSLSQGGSFGPVGVIPFPGVLGARGTALSPWKSEVPWEESHSLSLSVTFRADNT